MLSALTAYLIIPLYTILFAAGSDWFDTNFSVIGNMVGRQAEFVLWGLIVGIYFFRCLRRIIRLMPVPFAGAWLVPFSLLLLTFALTTPYLPERLPLKAFLHVVFAFLSAVCLLLCLALIIGKLYRHSREGYRSYLAGIIAIAAVSAALLLAAGIVSSALEIFFTISTAVLSHRLQLRLAARR